MPQRSPYIPKVYLRRAQCFTSLQVTSPGSSMGNVAGRSLIAMISEADAAAGQAKEWINMDQLLINYDGKLRFGALHSL